MSVVKKTNRQAALALALALGCAASGGANAFADEVGERLTGMLSSGSYSMTCSCGQYLGHPIHVPVNLGSDSFYMRGQAPYQASGLVPLGNLLDAPTPQPGPFDAPESYGAGEAETNYSIYATPFYSNLTSDGADPSKNWSIGADEYRMERVGAMVGATYDVTARTTVGWVFAYSNVEMSQSFPVADDTVYIYDWDNHEFKETASVERHLCGIKMDADDIQFGVTFSHMFDNEWNLAGNIQGGSQRYYWKRRMQARQYDFDVLVDGEFAYDDYDEMYEGDISGNTFSVNVSLSRMFNLAPRWAFTPSVGVDSAHSWMYRANESGRNLYSRSNPEEHVHSHNGGNFWHAYGLTETLQYNRVTARAGGQLDYDGGNFGFNAKAFYGTQLGGDDCAEASIASLDGETEYRGRGLGFGRDTLRVGGGPWLALNESNTATLGGGYETTFYKRATTQTATGSFTARF